MKKFTSILAVLLVLAISMAAPALAEIPADANLKAARAYLNTMYKNSPETTMTDYEVVSKIMIGDVEFPIEWTADSDTVKIIPGDNKMVTIDVDEKIPKRSPMF